jgi:murein DD-endopeptidase MepM/ murein hydrolase activator NlpD
VTRYQGRHRQSSPSLLKRGKVILPTTAVVAGAVAVGAVSTANGATIGSASMLLHAADAKTSWGADTASTQEVSRSTTRTATAVDAKVKAATQARAKARDAAISRANTLRAAAKKKAVLAALSTATPAKDHVEAVATDNTTASLPVQGGTAGQTRATQAAPAAGTGNGDGYVCPIAGCGGQFTSGYGFRVSPGGIGSTNHGGIDLSTPIGTPLRAMRSGTVTEAGWYGGCGMRIVIDYGNGVSSWYCHLSGFAASPGQQVGQGQVVAWSGNSGNSTGPHLHLEIHLGGVRVNPYPWLASRGLI